MFITDNSGRTFRSALTIKKITDNILLDDITQTVYINSNYVTNHDEYITFVVPYDKLNLAGGFSKINY